MDTSLSMLSVSSIYPSNLFHFLTSLFYTLMVFQLLCSLLNNVRTDLTQKCILPNSFKYHRKQSELILILYLILSQKKADCHAEATICAQLTV